VSQSKNVKNTAAQTEKVEFSDGDLKYVVEKKKNNSLPSYEEASGAYLESHFLLGYAQIWDMKKFFREFSLFRSAKKPID
jgi:hypothetical protein